MEKDSRYFIVGVFATLSLLALTIFIVWLAGTHDARNYARYTIHFRDPVSGLKESAVVQYRGVEVGRVRNVKISRDRNDLVKVDIEIDAATPITSTTEAALATQGFTGIVYIDLSTKEGGGQEPPMRVEGERYPVIPGKGTHLSKLFQDIPAISKQVLNMTEKLNEFLSEDNMASLSATIKNIEKTSEDLNILLNEENIQNTSEAIRNLSSTSENIDQLVARFNKTADEIDKAVSSINEVVTENKAGINRFAGSGLQEISDMAAETREMAKSIRRLADRLEQEPSRILYQPNYRGVEVKE
jgi:phospholipid/cholesterol/gamma-HCH transport system substrate-binding protein